MSNRETAKDIADNFFERVKNMQTFRVVRKLDDRNSIFGGRIPFDVKVNQENVLTATVYAVSRTEAEAKVDEWLDRLEGEY